MQVVVPARDDGGDRQAAVGGQLGNLALPRSGQHVADLADAVLHRIVDRVSNSMPVICAAIFMAVHGSRAEDAGAAQQAAKADHGGD